MIKAYKILLITITVIAALWFFPWLYGIIFPDESSDPFIAYSPVADCFVVSEFGESSDIYTVDADGNPVHRVVTKNDRDSLVPQMYYNQLNARGKLPDSVGGKKVDIPELKNSQWVFNSIPRDLNKVDVGVYPIMESLPKRLELEDPVEVFTLDGEITFIDMATNTVNQSRSQKFGKVMADRGFCFPIQCTSANITAKKGYDEGYLLVDAAGKVYHMKMQAGQPYMASVKMPEGVKATKAFILENPDKKHIGLFATTEGDFYAIEREGYKPVKLPICDVNPQEQRITIFKSLYCWVIKVSDSNGSRWVAINSDDYSKLADYHTLRTESNSEKAAKWIFPFRITFCDINDCYAYPRISDFSLKSLVIWVFLFIIIYMLKSLIRKKQYK